MGNPKGFLEVERKEAGYRPIHDRIHDFGEVEQTLNSNDRRLQASRCMDCGVPFCHWASHCTTKHPSGTTPFTAETGRKPTRCSRKPTIFPSSRGAFVPPSAKRPAY